MSSLLDPRSVTLVLGVFAHCAVFCQFEWHVQAPVIFRSYFFMFILVFIGKFCTRDSAGNNLSGCLKDNILLFSFHFIGLFGSMMVYRGLFHPLRRFPGPLFAKYTKFWHVWKCRDSQNHLLLESLRHRYGDFVRTGPNELTIFHPDGLNAINKPDATQRSGWYDLLHPTLSINTVRDQESHDNRRKLMEKAFTAQAMVDYEKRIRGCALEVEKDMSCLTGKTVDMNSFIYRVAYNVMSDLAFSRGSSNEDAEWETSVKTLHTGLALLGPLSPAPWIALLAFSFERIPLVADWNRMMAYCHGRMDQRLTMRRAPRPDISSWLIEDAKTRGQTNSPEEMHWLHGDSFGMILAGSDTTASTMVFAFYHLAREPEYQERINDEIRKQMTGEFDFQLAEFTYKKLEGLQFLNAFINETLRLHHPLPTSGSRVVRDPRGLSIGDQHIPVGVNLVAPRWSFGRQDAHFKRSSEFVPDRWLGKSDMILDRRAFTPWANGKWACLGKPIALFELRYMIALLVCKYSISFPAGDDGSQVERGYKDQVTAFPGRLDLVFVPRL